MTDIAIRVENLSKLYHIGVLQQRHDTLRDALSARVRRNPKSQIENPKSDELWALRDVSFEVKRGEVVGIIGRNGAGKSTLLKILSRITEPTSGRAEIHGRVGSLLEVGTGFHPELTGRENIYLNGAILGMRRTEIDRQFDEIVAFAEIEKFLETPVKRYSSGMYVRLAFAVAAHLEPEILLVDEVLAVGDIAFQRKCLLRMEELAHQGSTILFVSHNMHSVGALATKCIYLRRGSVTLNGETQDVIGLYLGDTAEAAEAGRTASNASSIDHSLETGAVETCAISCLSATNFGGLAQFESKEGLQVNIGYSLPISAQNHHFQVTIWSEMGLLLTCADSRIGDFPEVKFSGRGHITCVFPANTFVPGRYLVRAYIISADTNWPVASFGWTDSRVCSFTIKPAPAMMSTGMVWYPDQQDFGFVTLPHRWQIS